MLRQFLSVRSSNKNCHSWMGPEPVKQGPDDDDSGMEGGGVGCCGRLTGGRVKEDGGRHGR